MATPSVRQPCYRYFILAQSKAQSMILLFTCKIVLFTCNDPLSSSHPIIQLELCGPLATDQWGSTAHVYERCI